jgi:putative ABC transport system permease protein
LATLLETDFPEVEKTTRAMEGKMTLKLGNENVREKRVLYVDDAFFHVFTVKTLAGDPRSMPANPDAVLLTPESARRYFGTHPGDDLRFLVGKTLERGDGKILSVAGVVEAFPAQSHLRFDFLASLKSQPIIERRRDQWGSATCLTYCLLREGASKNTLDQKLQKWVDNSPNFEDFRKDNNFNRFPSDALTEIHLAPNRAQVWMFGCIAAFILLLACVNFINLSTARAFTRAREVGIRKVLGSQRTTLAAQFFGETALQVLLAGALAIVIVQLVLPSFNHFADKSLQLDFIGSPFLWALLAGLILITALLSGAFPAAVLSAFAPVRVLRSLNPVDSRRNRLRQGLVVFQFFISSALIIGTLVVRGQLDFIQNRDLGFDREQVVVLRGAQGLDSKYAAFMNLLRSLGGVESATAAMVLPGDGFDSTLFLPEQPANYKETSLSYTFADAEFLKTMKLELAGGRNFVTGSRTDSVAFIINETAAKRLGWADPLGKKINDGQADGQVIGVVKDFNFSSLHEDIQPLLVRLSAWNMPNIAVRLRPGVATETLDQIRQHWKEYNPKVPFDFVFLDDHLQKQYAREQRTGSVFLLFSVMAILIACLGLFGLASFMAAQRVKEIGIRKVLGASVGSVTGLLARDFLQLVVVATLLACPIAYYFMQKWLSDFAYRIEMQWWMFVAAGAGAVLIAALTVGGQAIKAALANPVKSLRGE